MTTYTFSGTTQQQGSGHTNIVAAIKVDPNNQPVFEILNQVKADVTGEFVLTWDDWPGRIIILVIDDEGSQPLAAAGSDWLVGQINT